MLGQTQETAQKCLPQTQGLYIPIAGKFYYCGALCQRCIPHKSANEGWAMVNARVVESSPDMGPDYIGRRLEKGQKFLADWGWIYAIPEEMVDMLAINPLP